MNTHWRGILLLSLAGGLPAAWASEDLAPRPESRGVWLDKGQVLEGREKLLTRLDRLKEAGFNTVYVAMQIRGGVMYPDSKVLPQYAEAARNDPQVVEWLLPALHERGLRAEAWTEFGFYAYWTPDAAKDSSRGPILDSRPELAAVDRHGQALLHNDKWGDYYALCPANPRAQDVLIELYGEMLERYAFDGLNLDRIRFPDERFCHCRHCRERFQADTGVELGDFAEKSREAAAFGQWRKDQLTGFVGRLSQRLRERFPKARITAAVVPPAMIDEKGQDWPTWLERGYLDAAMPMLYAADISAQLAWVRKRLGAEAAVFAGLDAGGGAAVLMKQVGQVREQRFPGLTIWHAATVDPLLPELARGVFAAPAVSPLYGEKVTNGH